MEQRHREHAHAQEMFEKVERFLASALSQAEFCGQEGLAYWTFRYWLKKYRLHEALSPQTRAQATTDEAPTDFIPLRIAPVEPAAQSSACAIEYPSGIVVRFNHPIDATVLAQLIQTTKA
ncbi:MAG: hypothetical protein AAB354_09855 [candidate division KSB1 bacterium]